MIYETPKSGSVEEDLLADLDRAREKLSRYIRRPKRWHGVLLRNTLARAILGSNTIEGYTVSEDDAIAAVEGQEPISAQKETWEAIIGYRNAMTYVLQLAEDSNFAYSEAYIRSLHYMMMQYDINKHPGNYRPGAIYVRKAKTDEVVYKGPRAEEVPGLMAELVASLNRSEPCATVIKAAMAHLNLVMIHPFSDGNGRMARCLQTLALSRDGMSDPIFSSIEEYLGRYTQEYYSILAQVGEGRWHPHHDARPWVQFCLAAHCNQAAKHLQRVKETENVWGELERLVAERKLPERAIFALQDATLGFVVRNASYRKMVDVSDQVASRDFKLLVKEGLLVTVGEKRGRVYRASGVLKEMRKRTREPAPTYKSIMPKGSN